jgi:hypothetical protein
MILLALLMVAEIAATPSDGWRVQASTPSSSTALRAVAVPGDPVGDIVQLYADQRAMLGPVALDVELPWVTTWGGEGRWLYSYPGNLRLGISTWPQSDRLQLGLEGSVPTTRDRIGGYSWGSLAKESLPTWELGAALHSSWSTGLISLTGRLFLGGRWGDGARGWGHDRTESYGMFVWDIASVFAVRVMGPVSMVHELEWLQDPAYPVSTRPFLRLDLPVRRGCLSMDLGLQINQETLFGHEPVQPIAQLRWYPTLH